MLKPYRYNLTEVEVVVVALMLNYFFFHYAIVMD